MDVLIAVVVPVAALAAGVWCGIRIERHRRDRELQKLVDNVRDDGGG